MLLLLTLTHCLGGNRSHSTREDVYFVDEVLVDFADRGQTCVVKLVVVYKIRSLQARNDSGTVSSRHRYRAWSDLIFIYNRPVWLEPIALLLAILFLTDTGILLIPALLIPRIVPLSVIIFLATLFHYRGHFSPEIGIKWVCQNG